MNTDPNQPTTPPMTCEELERAAIAAYHKEDEEQKIRSAKWKLETRDMAFDQLKLKFPLLEKNPDVNDSDFIMCGRKWRFITTGFYPQSNGKAIYSYALSPLTCSGWAGWVSDMADLGRFLLAQKDFEREQEERKPFWKRFF